MPGGHSTRLDGEHPVVRIRTTMTPTVEQEVSEATADDLRAQGVLLEGTRATTDEGLTRAALRQVRERSYTAETRAGIAEAARRAAAMQQRREQPKRRPRGRAARQPAPTSTAAPDAAAPSADTATDHPAAPAAPTSDEPAPAGAATTTGGHLTPADATTQES